MSRRCVRKWIWVFGVAGCLNFALADRVCAVEPSLALAWKKFQEGEIDAAGRMFQSIGSKAPTGSEERWKALYGEANWRAFSEKDRDVGKAVELFRKVEDGVPPEDELAAWSAFEAAQLGFIETTYSERDYAMASKSFLETHRKYPESAAGDEAFVVGMNLARLASEPSWTEVIAECEEFLRKRPEGPWTSRVLLLMAEGFAKLGEFQKQRDCLARSLAVEGLRQGTLSRDNSTDIWNIAYLSEFEIGDFVTARKFYTRLIEEYPRDNRVFLARKAMERMEEIENAVKRGEQLPAVYRGAEFP